MFYILTLVPVVLVIIAIYRYWVSARQLNLFDDIVRRAPNWLPLDGVAVGSAGFVLYYAAMSWWGFTIPMLNKEPLSELANLFMAMVSCFGCLGLAYYNAGKRFEHPSWAGMRESVLRSATALRIIDAVELARLLDVAAQQYETHHAPINANNVIEVKAREVQK